jgi:hypothetical protein
VTVEAERRLQWYATSAFWEERVVSGATLSRPASLAHAKRMGTTKTACGLPATSWRKFYDVPFPLPAGDNCTECLDATAEPMRGRRARRG